MITQSMPPTVRAQAGQRNKSTAQKTTLPVQSCSAKRPRRSRYSCNASVHSLAHAHASRKLTLALSPQPFSIEALSPPLERIIELQSQRSFDLVVSLMKEIQNDPISICQAVWRREPATRRASRFNKYEVSGRRLTSQIVNSIYAMEGNLVGFPLVQDGRVDGFVILHAASHW